MRGRRGFRFLERKLGKELCLKKAHIIGCEAFFASEKMPSLSFLY